MSNTIVLKKKPITMQLSIDKIDQFMLSGAFIQLEADKFRLFWGPFQELSPQESDLVFKTMDQTKMSDQYIATCDFWSFLESKNSFLKLNKATAFMDLNTKDFIELCQQASNYSFNENIIWNDLDSTFFKNQFDWIKSNIYNQVFEKALPINLQTAKFNFFPKLPFSIENVLKSKNGISYGMWNDQKGFIGSTPELLAEYFQQSAEVVTVALAGTWPKKNKQLISEINFNDQKIKNEHNIVIEDIKLQMNQFEIISQSDTHLIELTKLFHLKTNFVFKCDTYFNFIKAVQQLHPTAALGVYPRNLNSMKQFSNLNLQKNRHQFGSPFGVISADYNRMLVAIRNIFWNKNEIELFAGCGITSQSEYESEWDEVLSKQLSVKEMLGLIP